MIALVKVVRAAVYKNKPDPIEQVVSQALGNKDLVLGSKLKLWVETLGEPNLIANCKNVFSTSKLFWLNHGIAVEVDGEISEGLDSSLNKRVNLIILPIKKSPSPALMKNCQLISITNNNTKLEFEKLLDVRIEGFDISNIKETDIRQLYQNYDASNDYYYNMAFPVDKVTVRLFKYPDADCAIACRDVVNIIQIANSDIFSISGIPRFLKRLVSFPFIILKLLWVEVVNS